MENWNYFTQPDLRSKYLGWTLLPWQIYCSLVSCFIGSVLTLLSVMSADHHFLSLSQFWFLKSVVWQLVSSEVWSYWQHISTLFNLSAVNDFFFCSPISVKTEVHFWTAEWMIGLMKTIRLPCSVRADGAVRDNLYCNLWVNLTLKKTSICLIWPPSLTTRWN